MAEEGDETSQETSRFETRAGLALAVLAAVLAVTDLGAGKFGDDELIAVNEKSSAYQWYASKSIKQTIIEGQASSLHALLEAGAVSDEALSGVEAQIEALSAEAERYGLEKKEILLGSAGVGPEGWVQDVDGELGKVTGALEWGALADKLNDAGDRFDVAILFLQLCLVQGAISIVMDGEQTKRMFFWLMLGLGALGSVASGIAFSAAL